jgi:glycosyltransferase involved in cell wall biosynthesis
VADDPDEFARAAARLHEDAALWTQLSAAGREHARQRYSDEAVVRRLHELLDATAWAAPP